LAVKTLVPTEEVAAPTYSTTEVVRGDISVGVDVSGSLNPSWGGGISVPGGWGTNSTVSS
jgi:HlyD family secretion protein